MLLFLTEENTYLNKFLIEKTDDHTWW